MPRATIVYGVDDGGVEEALYREWLAACRDELSFVSDDGGCGCCVHIFNVQGSESAIEAIPRPIAAGSDWLDSDLID